MNVECLLLGLVAFQLDHPAITDLFDNRIPVGFAAGTPLSELSGCWSAGFAGLRCPSCACLQLVEPARSLIAQGLAALTEPERLGCRWRSGYLPRRRAEFCGKLGVHAGLHHVPNGRLPTPKQPLQRPPEHILELLERFGNRAFVDLRLLLEHLIRKLLGEPFMRGTPDIFRALHVRLLGSVGVVGIYHALSPLVAPLRFRLNVAPPDMPPFMGNHLGVRLPGLKAHKRTHEPVPRA